MPCDCRAFEDPRDSQRQSQPLNICDEILEVVSFYTSITVTAFCIRAAVVTDRLVAGIADNVVASGAFQQ